MSANQDWLLQPDGGFLSDVQTQQLDVLFARLWPEDAARFVPGAVRLGASRFVSLLLARPPSVYREILVWRAFYPRVLEELERYAQAAHHAALTSLTDEQVNALLRGLEGKALAGFPTTLELPDFPGETYDQARVFITLLRHCWQGCASDPRWGGNKEKLLWRCIGYAQPAEDVAFAAPPSVDEGVFFRPQHWSTL